METQRQSAGLGEKARRKFSRMGGRAPGYRLSPGWLWLSTKNALYYCARSANSISWVFFREFVHDGCRLDHSLSVSCTKEMHTKTKSKDAFPVTCVAWRFCREQSPRGSAALARLSYFARRTKTAMLLRLLFQKYKLELTTGIHAHSHEKWIHIFWVYRDYSNSLSLSNASELCRSWTSINHIQIDKEKENFVVACLRPSQAGIVKREIRHFQVVVVQWRQRNVQKRVMFFFFVLFCHAKLLLFWLSCSNWIAPADSIRNVFSTHQ